NRERPAGGEAAGSSRLLYVDFPSGGDALWAWTGASLAPLSPPGERGESVALPVHVRGIGPEVLQGVIAARVGVEDVDDHVAVVLHDPAAGLVALDREALVAGRPHRRVDLLGDGVDLAAAGAGTQDEVVVKRGQAAHVEDKDVFGLVLLADAG